MKKLLFILILLWGCQFISNAQCIIYASDATGAFGAGYNNDNTPTSMQECEDVAIKTCEQYGATDCTFLYKSTKAGWFAFINGQKADGRNYFQGGDGYSTQQDAEDAVRKMYAEDGGVNASTIKVYTWYTYANPK